MGHTFVSATFHIVFATHERRPMIDEGIRRRLYEYIGGIARADGCVLRGIGGTADHVHLLLSMQPSVAMADMMRALKAKSSKWVHETFLDRADFAWQAGYGAFSVSESNADKVLTYIAHQDTHHRQVAFRDELRALLRKHGVDFDERYI